MIDIPDLGEGFLEMWQELLFLAGRSPAPWTLIGAHMVALHAWKVGRRQPRGSRDADVLVNVRMVSGGTKKVSELLISRRFTLDGVSPEGIGHRFVKGRIRLDVLGPDGVGSRTSLGTVPLPNLLGALLVKTRAISVDDQPQAQRADVAFLLSLVQDPDPLVAQISRSERGWLCRHPEFADSASPCYAGILNAVDAATVFRRLVRTG